MSFAQSNNPAGSRVRYSLGYREDPEALDTRRYSSSVYLRQEHSRELHPLRTLP